MSKPKINKSALRVNSIESFSTKDGDGVRSVIFFQGCKIHCNYCHNPETWDTEGGEQFTPEALADKILRFREYWGSNGGVTISGGEPLLQAKELVGFLQLLKSKGVNITLDTTGSIFNDDVSEVIKLCDLIIIDIKYKKEFLDFAVKQKKKVWMRIVIVPGENDTESAVEKYANELSKRKIEKVELVPFHTLGFDKYKKMGIKNPLEGVKGCSVKRAQELQRYFESIRK